MKGTRTPNIAADAAPTWHETLRDRSQVLIRPIRPQDREAERAFIEGLSSRSRRYRFLGGIRHPDEDLLSRLTAPDPMREAAFVAVRSGNSDRRIVGVGRFSADSGDETRCECAVVVADEWQHKGLGSLLMQHLIEVATARGFRTMYSVDLADNVEMLDMARHFGFQTMLDPDDPSQAIHELHL